MDMINLDKIEKGQKVDLTKGTKFTKFYFGLGWKAPTKVGGHDYDLDVSAILVGADGKILNGDSKNFVFYGLAANQGDPFQHESGCVKHTGDNMTGDKDGDDEVLIIDTSLIPAGVEEISVVITIHKADERGQNFGAIKDAKGHIFPANADDTPVMGDPNVNFEFDLNEDFSMFTAIQVGSVYTKNGEWKYDNVLQGFKADLRGVLTQYGASVK